MRATLSTLALLAAGSVLALVIKAAGLQLTDQMQLQVRPQQPNYGYVFPTANMAPARQVFVQQQQAQPLVAADQNAARMESAERSRREATSNGSAHANSTQRKKNRGNKKKKQKSFEADCLLAHNKWRALHRVGKLEFDRKIAAFAQKRADFIAASDGAEFRHPPDLPYGENLAWHSRETLTCAELIKMWYDEVDLYDFGAGQFSHETGHFTQLVWRSTERVGCARAIGRGPKGGVYLVCNYDPPGNYLNEARDNVFVRDSRPPQRQSGARPTTAGPTAPPATTTTAAPTTTTTTTTTVAPPTDVAVGASATTKKPNEKRKKKRKRDKKKKNKSSTTHAPNANAGRPEIAAPAAAPRDNGANGSGNIAGNEANSEAPVSAASQAQPTVTSAHQLQPQAAPLVAAGLNQELPVPRQE